MSQRIISPGTAESTSLDPELLTKRRPSLLKAIRKGGQNSDRVTSNGTWGRFVHFTSRPVDGTPDPQLHAHCFMFNSTFDETENRWKAAQIASIKRDANYFSALMHSRFAARLTELGIPIERTAKGWRIEGLGEATEQKFSRRTQQIEEAAERMGISDPDEKAGLGAMTRDGKNKKLTMDELRALWLSRLTPDESDVVQRLQEGIHDAQPKDFDARAARDAIGYAADHHFEGDSVVPERKLLTTALQHSVGVATPETIFKATDEAPFIRGDLNGREMLTSPVVLAEEQKMIAFARDGRGEPLPRLVPRARHFFTGAAAAVYCDLCRISLITRSIPTVKQHMAAIKMFFDDLVLGQCARGISITGGVPHITSSNKVNLPS